MLSSIDGYFYSSKSIFRFVRSIDYYYYWMLAGKHDVKPSHEELKDWLHSGQVDVLRINTAAATR
jgi:hypothetical protein